MQQGDYGKARPLLENAKKGDSLAAELGRRAELLLAECHRRLGNPDERLRACRRALENDPLWLPARRELAAALADAGKLEQAIREYRKIVAQAPEVRGVLAGLLIASNLRQPATARDWEEAKQLVRELAKDKQRVPRKQSDLPRRLRSRPAGSQASGRGRPLGGSARRSQLGGVSDRRVEGAGGSCQWADEGGDGVGTRLRSAEGRGAGPSRQPV